MALRPISRGSIRRVVAWLTVEVESNAETWCEGKAVRWEALTGEGWVEPADDGGIFVPPIETDLDYLVCLHEIAHVAPFPETDAWLELVEERDSDATDGELQVEVESFCWLWAIENASISLGEAGLVISEEAIAVALGCLATYEEWVEWTERPAWRRGPARRALERFTEGDPVRAEEPQ
jgi:hypothetical protein